MKLWFACRTDQEKKAWEDKIADATEYYLGSPERRDSRLFWSSGKLVSHARSKQELRWHSKIFLLGVEPWRNGPSKYNYQMTSTLSLDYTPTGLCKWNKSWINISTEPLCSVYYPKDVYLPMDDHCRDFASTTATQTLVQILPNRVLIFCCLFCPLTNSRRFPV